MSILNKYFLKQLTLVYIALLLVLTGLSWMLQILTMMKVLLNYGVNFFLFLKLSFFMIPFIVSIIIPFITFISVIYIYIKLINDNEITVIASNGISSLKIAKPALIFAILLSIVQLVLKLWLVPVSQDKFYNMQWELRYGLANIKLQENNFNKISNGLVVYVDKVIEHDLSKVMISDIRDRNDINIFAEKGQLITTGSGLSIAMYNGSMQIKSDIVGEFKKITMDLNIVKDKESEFKVRRISTYQLIRNSISKSITTEQKKQIFTEIYNRFLSPIINFILVLVCVTVLLSFSFLRRRISFAPLIAIIVMAIIMSIFMSVSNIISSWLTFYIVLLCLILFICILFKIIKK